MLSAFSQPVCLAADVDTGLRRSERASKPVKRQSDLVDLPDTDEEEDKQDHIPDEASQVCMLMPHMLLSSQHLICKR